MRPLLQLQNITVRFPGVLACDRACLKLRPGEIHSVVGENGAGKSTLMHIAAGVLPPTSGAIRFSGEEIAFLSPQDAQRLGVCMVFQSFLLVDRLTVLDNIVLGLDGLPAVLERRKIARALDEVCSRLGIELDFSADVSSLSAGEKQKTALVRALHRRARVLILDEPTAVLTPGESDRLMETMKRLSAEGMSLLFVSHKLPEIMSVSDRITVMHRGRTVAQGVAARGETSADDIAAMMVGETSPAAAMHAGYQVSDPQFANRPPTLRIERVELTEGGAPRLRGVSLELRPGEIVGIAGVSGNGQKALASVCAGVVKPTAGRVLVGQEELTGLGPRRFFDSGVSYVSEDRYHEATAGPLSITESCCLKSYRGMTAGALRFLDKRAMEARCRDIVERFSVKASGTDARTASLSGGNLQKLILGRELYGELRVLIIHQPTQGLDLASARFVREQIRAQAEAGVAILLISSDLDEVMRMCSRLLVMYKGEFAGRVERADYDRRELGRLMAGLNADGRISGNGES